MDRWTIQDSDSGASPLSCDTRDARESHRTCHSKSCYEINSLGLLPRVFSSRAPAFSTSDFRPKSSHNLHSARKLSENRVRERHHSGSKEPVIARRSLSTAARRRSLLDPSVGRKTSASSYLGEKHRGLSNHNSLIENRRRRTASNILHPSLRNSEAEYTIENTISTNVSQSSKSEQRRQSSPNIRIGITNRVTRKRTSQSSFNVLSETDPFSTKKSSTTVGLETESESNAVHGSVGTSNHTNVTLSKKNTRRTEVQNGAVGSNPNSEDTKLTPTLRSFFFCDNVQSRISSPSEHAPYRLDERNKQQQQVDRVSKLNKSSIEGLSSCLSSFYVKQGALLPLRSHQLLSKQGRERSFEDTRNPYYTFLPEFNQSSAESVYKKYDAGSICGKNSCLISTVLPTKNLSICSKASSFSSDKTDNFQKQTNTDASSPANEISQGLANCITYFQHNSGGNLYRNTTNENSPYFNILRALSRMREDARLLKNNNSIFNSPPLLSEVQEESPQTDHTKYLELSDSQRHSGTPLPVYDIIAKKVSSGILTHTSRKQSRVLGGEAKGKQFASEERDLCETSTERRIINYQIESKRLGNICEEHIHQRKPQDTHTQTHRQGEKLIQLRDNQHVATKSVETVFVGPSSSTNDDSKGSNAYQVHAPVSDEQCLEESSVHQSKGTCSALTHPFKFCNRGNIDSSSLSLLSNENELPSCTLLERPSLNSSLGSSLSEFQYYDVPSARSLNLDTEGGIDTSESLIIQSELLQRRKSSRSRESKKEMFLSSTISEKMNSQNKDISQVQVNDDGQYLITQEMLAAPKKDSEGLPVSSEPMLSRPTVTNESSSKPGPRRGGSPKPRSTHHKPTREQCKFSHSWANRPRIPDEQQQLRQADREEPLLSTFEGTLDTREIKVRECSKSIIDDRPLVLVSWDESASNEIEGRSESVQGKRSYSLLYWNNTPSETKCTKQNFTNLIKRIMSTISSSVVHIDSKLSSESTRSLSAPQSSPSTKKLSSLVISSNIKQDSQNRINICKTGNIICAHSISDTGSQKQQVERITCPPESNIFRRKDQTQNVLSRTLKESTTASSEGIASLPNKEKAINNNKYEDVLKYNSNEEPPKEQLLNSQEEILYQDEQSGFKVSPGLPVTFSSKKLFTQQLQEKDKVTSSGASNTLPWYKGQAVPIPSSSSSNEWSMCIECPKSSKRALYSWWKGKQRSVTTYSKLFDSMGMCYLASSDEEISSEDDCNVISWNE